LGYTADDFIKANDGKPFLENKQDGDSHRYVESGKYADGSLQYDIIPPDVQLRPRDRYTLLIKGDNLVILDQKSKWYKGTLKLFLNYSQLIERKKEPGTNKTYFTYNGKRVT